MKALVVAVSMLFLVGCAGLNTTVPVQVATDVAFVLVLQNNPSYKAPVVKYLELTKKFLEGEITYDDLNAFIVEKFGGEYAYIGVILMAYISTDKPLFETYLPMFEAYKEGVALKIDRFIMLAKL